MSFWLRCEHDPQSSPHCCRILTILYVTLWGSMRRKFREKVIFWADSLHLSKMKLHLFPLCAISFEKGSLNDIYLLLTVLARKITYHRHLSVESLKDFETVSKSDSKKKCQGIFSAVKSCLLMYLLNQYFHVVFFRKLRLPYFPS